jgi:aspartyl-tRNA(Asn)/glutamyl-tRNA(Gln) amidotransferase subunit C
MQLADVKHLATLARLDIPEEEQQALLADLEAMIAYVDQVTGVTVPDVAASIPEMRNTVREDVVTNVSGAQTETLLAEVPSTQDGFVKVKKIL